MLLGGARNSLNDSVASDGEVRRHVRLACQQSVETDQFGLKPRRAPTGANKHLSPEDRYRKQLESSGAGYTTTQIDTYVARKFTTDTDNN